MEGTYKATYLYICIYVFLKGKARYVGHWRATKSEIECVLRVLRIDNIDECCFS